MIGEIIKNGWRSWRNHKVSGIPFFISGIMSSMIFLIAIVSVVHIISPEFFGLAFSGKITEEYIVGLFKRYLENLNVIFLVAVAAILAFIVVDTFLRAWGIKVCSDSLDCRVNLLEGVKYAKQRFVSFFIFNILVSTIVLATLTPLYFIFRGINWANDEEVVIAVVYSLTYGFIWLALVMAIYFILTFVPYAIVLDREGILGGVKRGFRVLSKSLAETVIMWLVVALAGMAVSIPLYPLKFLGTVGEIASFVLTTLLTWLVVTPITTMWWIDLYRRKAPQL